VHVRIYLPSQVKTQVRDELNARNRLSGHPPIVRQEQIRARLRRAGELNRIGGGNGAVCANPSEVFGRLVGKRNRFDVRAGKGRAINVRESYIVSGIGSRKKFPQCK